MTILLKGERHAHVLSGSNNDTVLVAFDLPADSVLRTVSARINIIGVQTALERETSVMYALAAYLIEIDDPNAVVSYENLWDRFVPKYTDLDTIDLDTGAADTTPFWEPGEANFDEIFDIGNMPLKLWMHRRMLTFADPGIGGMRFQPAETPFEPQWIPADVANFRLNRSIRVRAPSVVILAIGNAGLDDTTTARPTLVESEWGQIQFVESTLERSLIHQLGVIEPGAETPWEESSQLLRKHLAPDIFEATAGAFLTEAYNCFVQMQFSHTVPGSMEFQSVDLTP